MKANIEVGEARMVATLAFVFGLVNLEMFSVSYLLPFIRPSLGLDNAEVGLVTSGYWIAFAISSCAAGLLMDKWGSRKAVLIGMMSALSICSMLSGISTSFATLLAFRLLMGLLEGPVLPIAQSIVAKESSAATRGLNMGIVQTLGASVIGAFLGPLLLTRIGTHVGWRAGFFLLPVPGVAAAFLIRKYVSEGTGAAGGVIRSSRNSELRRASSKGEGVGTALLNRNVLLCAIGASCCVAFIILGTNFTPLYYTEVRRVSAEKMGLMMGVMGVSSMILGTTLPALSDKFGRKPIAIISGLCGAALPLGLLQINSTGLALAAITFIGWAPASGVTLLFATIPSESIAPRYVSSVLGIVLAVSTVLGGVIAPALGGWWADRSSLRAVLLIEIGLGILVAASSLGLKETNPSRTGLIFRRSVPNK